jgi:hypothetical protein
MFERRPPEAFNEMLISLFSEFFTLKSFYIMSASTLAFAAGIWVIMWCVRQLDDELTYSVPPRKLPVSQSAACPFCASRAARARQIEVVTAQNYVGTLAHQDSLSGYSLPEYHWRRRPKGSSRHDSVDPLDDLRQQHLLPQWIFEERRASLEPRYSD